MSVILEIWINAIQIRVILNKQHYLQWTLIVIVSKSGISVAELAASHLYLASLSVTFVRIVISADTDLSLVLIVEWICWKNKSYRDVQKYKS